MRRWTGLIGKILPKESLVFAFPLLPSRYFSHRFGLSLFTIKDLIE